MNLWFLLWLLRKFLFSERAGALIKTISWFSIASVTIGVFALILVISIMNGFNRSMRWRLLAVEPHLVVEYDAKQKKSLEAWERIRSDLLVSDKKVLLFDYHEQDLLVKTADGFFGGAEGRGVEQEAFAHLQKEIVRNSAYLKNRDFQPQMLNPGDAYVGIDLARELGILEGDEITVLPPEALILPPGEVPPFEKLFVAGIMATQIADIDRKALYYLKDKTLTSFANVASLKSGAEVRLTDPLNYQGLQEEMSRSGLKVESWKDRNAALFGALRLEKFVVSVFLGLSALIACFSMITVIYLLMTQKRREIGLLMTLGLSSSEVSRVFTQLGGLLASFGLGGGLLTGLAASLYIQEFPLNILPDIYYDSRVYAVVDFQFVFFVALVAIVVGGLAAWLPARQFSRWTPAEALKRNTR